jgi:hypothetical protein
VSLGAYKLAVYLVQDNQTFVKSTDQVSNQILADPATWLLILALKRFRLWEVDTSITNHIIAKEREELLVLAHDYVGGPNDEGLYGCKRPSDSELKQRSPIV